MLPQTLNGGQRSGAASGKHDPDPREHSTHSNGAYRQRSVDCSFKAPVRRVSAGIRTRPVNVWIAQSPDGPRLVHHLTVFPLSESQECFHGYLHCGSDPTPFLPNDQACTPCNGVSSTVHLVDKTPPPCFALPCPCLCYHFRPGRNQKLLSRRLEICEKYLAGRPFFLLPRVAAGQIASLRLLPEQAMLNPSVRSRAKTPSPCRACPRPFHLSTATERPPSWT